MNANDSASEIAIRLRQWRKSILKSQEEFASMAGISVAIIRKCEGGSSIPGGHSLIAFAKTGVNLHWLLTGTGEMASSGSAISFRPFISKLRRLEEQMFELEDEICSAILDVLSAKIHEAKRIAELERKLVALRRRIDNLE
ncbi:MAG: helix-turn-helix transcriptional regulator [Nitrosomonas sp.]|nr:helix-turn-helix transcriptional regulator [Nitrosomonas sp.]